MHKPKVTGVVHRINEESLREKVKLCSLSHLCTPEQLLHEANENVELWLLKKLLKMQFTILTWERLQGRWLQKLSDHPTSTSAGTYFRSTTFSNPFRGAALFPPIDKPTYQQQSDQHVVSLSCLFPRYCIWFAGTRELFSICMRLPEIQRGGCLHFRLGLPTH